MRRKAFFHSSRIKIHASSEEFREEFSLAPHWLLETTNNFCISWSATTPYFLSSHDLSPCVLQLHIAFCFSSLFFSIFLLLKIDLHTTHSDFGFPHTFPLVHPHFPTYPNAYGVCSLIRKHSHLKHNNKIK